MSKKVVLDRDTWIDALTNDVQRVLRTLIEVCDQIVLNELIQREYREYFGSAVLPKLEKLREMQPRPKVIEPRMGLPSQISLLKSHRNLVQGAIRAQADIVIFGAERRGRWNELFQHLQSQFQLTVLAPEEYVASRSRGN